MIDVYAASKCNQCWNVYKLVRTLQQDLAWEYQTYFMSLEACQLSYHPIIIGEPLTEREEVDPLTKKGTRRAFRESDLVYKQIPEEI